MNTLRPLTLADAPAIAAAVDASRDALRRWMPWYRDEYDVHAAQEWIRHILPAVLAGTAFHFAIVDSDANVIGVISLEDVSQSPIQAMLGYWVATPLSGRGIGRWAIAQVLDWARDTSPIQIVRAMVAKANGPGSPDLEANGFQWVGRRGVDERGDTHLIYEIDLRAPSA